VQGSVVTEESSVSRAAGLAGQDSKLVKFACSDCGSRYALPAERLKGRVLTIRCKSCGSLFEVQDTWSVPPSSVIARGDRVWFVAVNKQHIGPMTAQDVRERLDAGQISAQTHAWRQGLQRWVQLQDLDEFRNEHHGGEFDSLELFSASSSPHDDLQLKADPFKPYTSGEDQAASEDEKVTPPAELELASEPAEQLAGEIFDKERAEGSGELQPSDKDFEASGPSETVTEAASPSAASVADALSEEDHTMVSADESTLDSEVTAVAESPEDMWAAALGDALPENPRRDEHEQPTLVTAASGEVASREPPKRIVPGLLRQATIEYPPGFAESTIGIGSDVQADYSQVEPSSASPDNQQHDIFEAIAVDREAEHPHFGMVEEAQPDMVLRRDSGARGHELVATRNEDSVLFSLDHLLRDAPVGDLAQWQGRRLPEDSLVLESRARALLVPPPSEMVQTAQEIQSRAGFGRLLLAAVMGAFLGAGTLLAAVYWISGDGEEELFPTSPAETGARATASAAASGAELKTPARSALRREAPKPSPAEGSALAVPTSSAAGSAAEPPTRLMAPSGSEAPESAASAEAKLVAPSPEDFAATQPPALRERKAERPKARRPRRTKSTSAAAVPADTKAAKPARPAPVKAAGTALAARTAAADAVDAEEAARSGTEEEAAEDAARREETGGDDEGQAAAPLTPRQIGVGLAKAKAGLQACRAAYDQAIALTLSFRIDGGSGRVTRARVLPALLDEELRECVAAAVLASARFPLFDSAEMLVTRPIFLR
jgi:DNA-directed RNA polymerase subunit RPC12/RpoP